MDDDLRSMMAGPAPLYILAALALALTWRRRGYTQSRDDCDRLIDLVVLGIAAQCLHFTEEFVTGFHVRAPRVLGLVPWSSEFFVTFNLVWLAVWTVSLVGIRHRIQAAWFPVWFFALAMTGNGVAHPLLSVATGGYFPGLYTSPVVGGIGLALLSRLWKTTGMISPKQAAS
jgi:hypothetical protein